VTWTPSGGTLIYAGHDSTIHFATFTKGNALPAVQTLRLSELPFTGILALSDKACVGNIINIMLLQYSIYIYIYIHIIYM